MAHSTRLLAAIALAVAVTFPAAAQDGAPDEVQALETERESLLARTVAARDAATLRPLLARIEEIDERLAELGRRPRPAASGGPIAPGSPVPEPEFEPLGAVEALEKRLEVGRALERGEYDRLPALLHPDVLDRITVLDQIELLSVLEDPDLLVRVVRSLRPSEARIIFGEPGFFARLLGRVPAERRAELVDALEGRGEPGREAVREGLEDYVRKSSELEAKLALLARLAAVERVTGAQSRAWAGLVADEVIMRENDARAKRLTEASDTILDLAISSTIGLATGAAAGALADSAGLAGATRLIVEGVVTTSGAGLSFAAQQVVNPDEDPTGEYLDELLGAIPGGKSFGKLGELGIGDAIDLYGNAGKAAEELGKLRAETVAGTVALDVESLGPRARVLVALDEDRLGTLVRDLPDRIGARLGDVPTADRNFVRNRILRDYWSTSLREVNDLRGALARDVARLAGELGATPAR